MKKFSVSLAALLLILSACKKDEQSPAPSSQNTLSGVWRVDSTEIRDFKNGDPEGSMVIIEFPHSLDFTLANRVIRRRFGQQDTTFFDMLNMSTALTDLDFDGDLDTTGIWIGTPNQKVELEWKSADEVFGTDRHTSIQTMYLSK
jgi:hypothetical protein